MRSIAVPLTLLGRADEVIEPFAMRQLTVAK
jgi:hypothetical protein